MYHFLIESRAPGRPVFVNTLFNCLATTNEWSSFTPLWQPNFITELIPEERCHLNGLAMDDGVPLYVTAFSRTNTKEGWRGPEASGCIIDVHNQDNVVEGLSHPHSPRLHQGCLWLLQSGTGELGYIDKGAFVPVSFHAGYPRGLSFMGDYALVGLSKDREKGEFDALPLGAALKAHDADAGCGIDVIDHATGERVHFLRFEDTINELYDVVPLPGCRNPQLIGINDDDIRTHYAIDIGGARGQAGA